MLKFKRVNMKPKKIYSKLIPAKGYISILILWWMVIREEYRDSAPWFTEIHESIHLHQEVEMLVIGALLAVALAFLGCGWWSLTALLLFYIWYVAEFTVKLFITRSWRRAYLSVSLEQEAFRNHFDRAYLERRHTLAWLMFLFKLNNKDI